MITIGLKSLADARRRPVEVLGGTFHKSEWMDSGEDTAVLSPTVLIGPLGMRTCDLATGKPSLTSSSLMS